MKKRRKRLPPPVQLGLEGDATGGRSGVRFGFRRAADAFLLRRQDDGPHRVPAPLQHRRPGDFSLLIAYAGYNFKNYHLRAVRNHGAWNLRVGRQFIAITREDWTFGQDVLTTEFSAVDQAFAVGASDGLQAFYGRDRGRMWFALSNGASGGKEDFPNNTTSQALLSARGEMQLLGDDWNTFNDLVGRKGRSLGVLLGVGSGYTVAGPNAPAGTPQHSGQVTVDVSVGGRSGISKRKDRLMLPVLVAVAEQLEGSKDSKLDHAHSRSTPF